MLIWNLRRVNDLIDKFNNIVDVEQNEIDWKDVEFEEFDLHQKFATSKIFDWLNDKFDAMFYIIVLKATEIKLWIV